jgi:hypothetical protein
MKKMQLVGGGFLPEFSTCSDLKPMNFDWTREDSPVKIFVDSGILPGIGYLKKSGERKIAWV